MTPEEENYIKQVQAEIENERLRRMNAENTSMRNLNDGKATDANTVELLLNLNKTKARIKHNLSGDVLQVDERGGDSWKPNTNDDEIILSNIGVNRIMNILDFYLNEDQLLTNYKEEQIDWKVRDFGIELNDLIYCNYESYFHYPTPEQLFEKYLPVVKKNNLKISENELYQKCVIMSKEEMRKKINHYSMMVLSLVDIVHATLLRALNGEFNKSIRTQYSVHESKSYTPSFPTAPPSKFANIKPRGW